MALIVLNKVRISSFIRKFSSKAKFVTVNVDDKSGVATLTLQRPPVNSLNLDLLGEISSSLTELGKSKCRGLILTSNAKTVFSAGLDLMEIYKPNADRLKNFWTTLQDTWIKLYGSSYPTVAVINGHAPAGGCLLSVSCEYRIMVKNYTIGLNETQLGLVAPKWFIVSMKNVVGQRRAEIALTTGHLFKTDEAASIGLIDEIVENKEEGIARAEKFLSKFKNIQPEARKITKQHVREDTIKNMIKDRENDLNSFIQYAQDPKTQNYLEKYMESLKAKSSKN
uniref:Enoyl-CoA delta isomerase 1, mitochondrial n=1 Tax=Anoplophora glabripennis TaxID=217634 RepID=V5GVQ4_ANOGL